LRVILEADCPRDQPAQTVTEIDEAARSFRIYDSRPPPMRYARAAMGPFA